MIQSLTRGGSDSERGPVDPRNSLRDGAQRFPRDRLRPGAKLHDADFRVILAADEDDLVAGGNFGEMADIHDGLIHGDSSEDRAALTTDKHFAAVAQQSIDAIAVAAGENGNLGVVGKSIRLPVAD